VSAAEHIETPPPRRRYRRRAGRIALALAIPLTVGLLGVWLARVPIAERFVDRTFAAQGVAARYRITDLGFGRQRLSDVVIGDPADPDLVADWIETYTDITSAGPQLTGLRAGRVRVRGRLVNGRVSLGAIDRLLPAPSGQPFALPALDLAVSDARMRLETPQGVIGLRLAGQGRLNDGFRGTLAATSTGLEAGGCRAEQANAVLAVRVVRAAPAIEGPVRATTVTCGSTRAQGAEARVDLALTPALDGWSGTARVALAQLASPGATVDRVAGTIGVRGTATRNEGPIRLISGGFATAAVSGAGASIDGTWRYAAGRAIVAGRVGAQGAVLPTASRRSFAALGAGTKGSPVAPLADALASAATRAASHFDVTGDLAAAIGGSTPLVTLSGLSLASESGARVALAEGAGVVIGHPAGLRIDGALSIAGGGLPSATARLSQPQPGGAVSGVLTMDRYAAGNASLALTPLRFTAAPNGTTRIATVATLSGPLGGSGSEGGRVDGLRMPLAALWDGGTRLTVNPACTPLAFDRLAISGLTLRPARLTLCPIDGALVRLANGRLAGGARLSAARLTGALGATPVTLAATGAEVRLAQRGFTVDGLAALLGSPERETRLAFARLDGRMTPTGIGGDFTGGAGQIGAVPLLLGAATGGWTLTNGKLGVTGAMTVSDAATDPRFKPLSARDVTLTLAEGDIAARATVFEPTRSVKVADVTLAHALNSGRGTAQLAVPGIAFGDDFQPDLLTRLTFGVIADVQGSISGEGDIAWSPDRVTSTGTFRTANVDLAAAFGPATGIAGEIRFTDLLALESAPAQVATIKSINPGVPVNDGRIVYRTLANSLVLVDSGRWPFAGGTLTLDSTLLDFSQPGTRRLTFRVAGMDAGQFLQQFDFKNLSATGAFDGVMPMLFDETGGRIEGGQLAVRPGGGTLAYVGELSEENLGFWGNVAFQALRSLRYRDLAITMNGPLAGEMVTDVRFAGVNQGEGAKSNFLVRRLQRLPFVFNVKIKAPFRGLIDSAASFYDPKRLVQRNLVPLLEQQNKRAVPPVQPPASEIVP